MQVIFERGDAVQAPRSVGEGLDELLFENAFRLEVVEERLCEALIGCEILRGEDYRVAGQAVSKSVQARTLFSGFGFRASRMAGIFATASAGGLIVHKLSPAPKVQARARSGRAVVWK